MAPEPTAEATKPAAPASAGPSLTSTSALPNELKDLPTPSGFSVVKDSPFRITAGNRVSATAQLAGKGEVDKLQEFYVNAFRGKGLAEQAVISQEDQATVIFASQQGGKNVTLGAAIEKVDQGVEITLTYMEE